MFSKNVRLSMFPHVGVARNPGMDRVWVWVCDPSLMFLAVAMCLQQEPTQRPAPAERPTEPAQHAPPNNV